MYYFIVNPNCRSGRGRKIWLQVKNTLDARGIPYKFAITRYAGHAQQIAEKFTKKASVSSPCRLIVLGGDGTIHEALSGIQNLDGVIFGFIPAGSGNDFCRGMKLPSDPMEALETILTFGKEAVMDVPVINCGDYTSRFGISCGIGYDAAVCHEVLTTPLKKLFNRLHLGKLVYVMIALKQMLTCKPAEAEIIVDECRTLKLSKMYFAAVMNQQYEGGGFRFCPKGAPDDGRLDLIAVDGIPKLKMLCILPTAFWGGHTRFKGIHILQCRTADIRTSKPLAVHIDGESGGIRSSMSVHLESRQLTIIVPDK